MKWTTSFKDTNYQNLHGEIDTMDKPISDKEIGSIMNNLQKKKAPGPDGFIGVFYQTSTVETIPICFQKIEVERILPNSLY